MLIYSAEISYPRTVRSNPLALRGHTLLSTNSVVSSSLLMSELCTIVLWGYHIICWMIGEGQWHWWGRQEFRLIPPLSQWVALAVVMTQREHDIPAIAMARDKLRMLAFCCHSLKPTNVCGSAQDFFLSAFSPILLCPLPDITRKRNKTEGKQIKKPSERESRKRFFILPLESQ